MVELIVATAVFLIALTGILYSYMKCLELQDLGRNTSLATAAVKNEMETIKDTSYSAIFTTYNNATFTAPGINGTGTVYVNNSNPNLLVIEVVFSWKQPNGRVIPGSGGQGDCYVQVTTQIYG